MNLARMVFVNAVSVIDRPREETQRTMLCAMLASTTQAELALNNPEEQC